MGEITAKGAKGTKIYWLEYYSPLRQDILNLFYRRENHESHNFPCAFAVHSKQKKSATDDALPKLVVMDTLHTRAGVSFSQFRHFLLTTMENTRQLVSDCQNMGVLTYPDSSAGDEEEVPGVSLH